MNAGDGIGHYVGYIVGSTKIHSSSLSLQLYFPCLWVCRNQWHHFTIRQWAWVHVDLPANFFRTLKTRLWRRYITMYQLCKSSRRWTLEKHSSNRFLAVIFSSCPCLCPQQSIIKALEKTTLQLTEFMMKHFPDDFMVLIASLITTRSSFCKLWSLLKSKGGKQGIFF